MQTALQLLAENLSYKRKVTVKSADGNVSSAIGVLNNAANAIVPANAFSSTFASGADTIKLALISGQTAAIPAGNCTVTIAPAERNKHRQFT